MVDRRLKVPDEAWHAMQRAEDRRQQQQRVDDVEGVVADEEHGAVGAQESAEPLEVDDLVPVVATSMSAKARNTRVGQASRSMGAPNTLPARARRRNAGAASARGAARSAGTGSTGTVSTDAGSVIGSRQQGNSTKGPPLSTRG